MRRLAQVPQGWIYGVSSAIWAALVIHAGTGPTTGSLLHDLADWSLMVLAMMLPLAVPGARFAVAGSLWTRRHKAALEYVAGFAGVWIAFGLFMYVAVLHVGLVGKGKWALALSGATATVWQASRQRQRAIARCGYISWPPAWGSSADIGTLRWGASSGVRCVATCWASILVMATAPLLPIMFFLLAVQAYERLPGPSPFAVRRWQRPALGYALLSTSGMLAAVGVA
jgi:predicted metal-binding membrane protein